MEKESSVDNSLDRRVDYLLDLMVQSDSCLMSSILQIWKYDLERIPSLDQNQIPIDVNNALLHGLVFFFFTHSTSNINIFCDNQS